MNPETREFKKGEFLFHENDRSRDLFIIRSGRVKIFKTTCGKVMDMGTIGPGAVLGEMALIDGKPRSASAVSAELSTATVISSAAFETKFKGIPSWFYSIIRIVSIKLRNANQHIERLRLNSSGINVILSLQYLMIRKASVSGCEKPVKISMAKAVSTLTALLSVKTDIVNTAFEYLRGHGFVSINNEMIECTDTGKFAEYCTFLRMYSRNAFARIVEIQPEIMKIITELQRDVNASSVSARTFVIGSGDFDLICSVAGCGAKKSDILAKLKAMEIFADAKPGAEPDTQAVPQFSVNCSIFYLYYLYSAYGGMVPGK
jgi:CRP-like cAMP-binding protein